MQVEAVGGGFLTAHPAAVYCHDGAGDVVAGGRAEKKSCAGEIFGLTPACGGDAFEDLAIASLIGLKGLCVGRGEVSGGDGVDLNPFGSPLVGESLGELGDSAFAGGVGWDADAALKAEERSARKAAVLSPMVAAVSVAARRLPWQATVAPACASATAMAAPRPLAEPVTRATLLSRRKLSRMFAVEVGITANLRGGLSSGKCELCLSRD